jgi:hypothetical protein
LPSSGRESVRRRGADAAGRAADEDYTPIRIQQTGLPLWNYWYDRTKIRLEEKVSECLTNALSISVATWLLFLVVEVRPASGLRAPGRSRNSVHVSS